MAEAADRDSVFVFALHKAGSVLLDNIVRDLCGAVKVPTVSLDLFCFNKGLPIEHVAAESVEALFNTPGYCFSGFRGVHPCLAGVDLSRHGKVVLVRAMDSSAPCRRSSAIQPKRARQRNGKRQTSQPVCGSAAVYVLSFFAVGVASDFRYGYWAVLAGMVGGVVAASGLPKPEVEVP